MAISAPQSTSGASGGRNATPVALAEINVTPLVDVMLVLLIVFMISAPLMQQGVQVDLPKANAQALNELPEQLYLTITRDSKVLINNNEIQIQTLKARLEAMSAAKPNLEVFIQADQSIPYGIVAKVMALVKQAAIQRVGLVTEPEK